MSLIDASPPTDAAELQNVLTRYVDSVDGYKKASEVVGEKHLSDAFLEISGRRRGLIHRVSSLITREGGKPDETGSAEALLHRWWISVRTGMSDEDLRTTLEECVRGERELQRTVKGALMKGDMKPSHQDIIADMAVEIDDTLQTFQTTLNH